jgi:hypothetical protein
MKKITTLFWCSVLILAPTRGALVYYFGLNPNNIYAVSSALLTIFGLISFRNMLKNPVDKSLVKLRNATVINCCLLGFFSIAYIVLQGPDKFVLMYQFIIFPIIFTLVKYNKVVLENIVHTIAAVTAFGVYVIYLIGISEGYDSLVNIQKSLYPNETIGTTGVNFLIGGYLGSNHDAANILVMCSTFYLSNTLKAHGFSQFLYLMLFFTLFGITLLTGSTSNISVFIACFFMAVFIWTKTIQNGMMLALFVIIGYVLFLQYNDDISNVLYFTDKFMNQKELDEAGGGIFKSLDAVSIFESLHSVFVGFGYVLQVPMIDSEIAFIKLLVVYGILPFLLLMSIIFSPLYYINAFRKRINNQARLISTSTSAPLFGNFIRSEQMHHLRQLVLSAMPLLCGALTLLHYGSLFRVTSIGLFCVFMALFYKEYIAYTLCLQNASVALK